MRKPLLALTGLLIAMLLILAGCAPAPTGSIRGRIVYYTNGDNTKSLKGLSVGEPGWTNVAVSGAVVSVAGRVATTDNTGYFMVSGVPARRQTVNVSHSAFRDSINFTVDVAADAITDITDDINMPMGHFLGVGISDYKYSNILDTKGDPYVPDLTGPQYDVANIQNKLFGAFRGHEEILRDTQATKANIITALNDARNRMSANDYFIFYYSGHGYSNLSGSSATRIDAIVPTDYYPVGSTSVNTLFTDKQLADIISTFPDPSRVIVIIDACKSGSFFDGTVSSKSISTKALSYTGCTVMSASHAETDALDSNSGGLFTRGIIQAMTTAKTIADKDSDRSLTVSEVFDYAYDYVVNDANNTIGQAPALQLSGTDPELLRW